MGARARSRGLTLVELLVVIAIIGLLIGIMLPALSGVRAAARAVGCTSKMGQLALAGTMHASDHQDRLPRSQHSAMAAGAQPWSYALLPYLGHDEPVTGPLPQALVHRLLRCPFDRSPDGQSYGINVYFELSPSELPGPCTCRVSVARRPDATVIFGELLDDAIADHLMAHFWTLYQSEPEVARVRHGRSAGYAFLDGHAADLPFESTFDPVRNINQWNPTTAR